MKILAISDTHMYHHKIEKQLLDHYNNDPSIVLIHVGDALNSGSSVEGCDFLKWYNKLPFKHKIYIPGNHDICLDQSCSIMYWNASDFRANLKLTSQMIKEIAPSVSFLLNDVIEVDGKLIGGLSLIPDLYFWAFFSPENNTARIMINFPKVDILCSHSPFNYTEHDTYIHTGSPSIHQYLVDNDVKCFINGHIHEDFGYQKISGVDCYNVALLNERYELTNPLTLIEI